MLGFYAYQQLAAFFPQLNKTVTSKLTPLIPSNTPKAKPLAKIPLNNQNPSNTNKNSNQPLSTSELSIQGIMTNGGQTVALINGKIVEKGDSIEGLKIIDINADEITILQDGKEEKVQVHH